MRVEYIKTIRTKLPRKLKKRNKKLGILKLTTFIKPRAICENITVTLSL